MNQLYIDGQWREPKEGGTVEVEDPSYGTVVAESAVGSAGDVEVAVAAARRAADDGPWPQMSPSDRVDVLWDLLDAMIARESDFAEACITEVGAPAKTVGPMQVTGGMAGFRASLEVAARGLDEPLLPLEDTGVAEFITREPRGVVSAISSWNAPHTLQLHQVGPALATGNTMVVKPALETPTCSLLLAELADDVGLPAGVLNVVTGGADVGAAMVDDPRVDMVAFIGSSTTGSRIASAAGSSLKRLLLELGGKSALVVLPDADIDAVVELGTNFTWFAGEGCGLLTRLVVPDALHDEVVAGIDRRLDDVVTGDAHDPVTDMGPVISATHRERVEGYITTGTNEGATVLRGGGRPSLPGYFVEPTILVDVEPSMTVAQEEIFGPVLSVIRYDGSEDAAVRIANDSPYGLTGAVFSEDRAAGLRVARRVRAGRMNVNNWTFEPTGPFGGYKQSGIGRMWGRHGVEEYTELKQISWR